MMSRSFILLLFVTGVVWAQSREDRCCECTTNGVAPRQSVDLVCLSPREMRAQTDHVEPLRPSGLGKGVNISGTVVLEVRFEPEGKVGCARAKSGHPIAIAAAMEAIRKWTFKPLTLSGAGKAGCGQITIKYRLRDRGSTTKVGRIPGRAEQVRCVA